LSAVVVGQVIRALITQKVLLILSKTLLLVCKHSHKLINQSHSWWCAICRF